jgi:isoleucyl-tRNA synthetase
LIVSAVDLEVGDSFDVHIKEAEGSVCARCWNVVPKVDADGLCPRCSNILGE